LSHQPVVGIPAANPERTRNMADAETLAGDAHDRGYQLVDRNHLLGADIERTGQGGAGEGKRALHTLIDIEERTRLLAVAPKFDLAAVAGLGDLPADRGRRLFAPAAPRAVGAEDIVITGDPDLHSEVTVIC